MKTPGRIFTLLLLCPLIFSCSNGNNQALSKEKAEQIIKEEFNAYRETGCSDLQEMWENRSFTYKNLTMRLKVRILGECPADGRSLYLSLHGGGSVAAPVNDRQWQNQIGLYTPAEGVYVAPRAPVDAWNMWFIPGMDNLLEMVIAATQCCEGVNPNKVYLMGYSAGGDGVWRLAPRMADSWAAASMMAGHPGNVSLVNLRNTPFMIWMGENDSAYSRNKLAVVRGKEMDALQKADSKGYIHRTTIAKGMGHWMQRQDTAAVEWMARFRRDPYPSKIVWQQEDRTHRYFYWAGVDSSEMRKGMTLIVSREGNRISIDSCDYRSVTLYLNDRFIHLDQPVSVEYRGKEIFKGKVDRLRGNIRESIRERKDSSYIFPSKVELTLN